MTSHNIDLLKIFTDEGSGTANPKTLETTSDVSEEDTLNLIDYFNLVQIADRLKPVIEGFILNYYFKHMKGMLSVEEDPFDPIYLSKLQPDSINYETISFLKDYSNINDLSDHISFDDGLDD